jgi:cytochrome P450
MPPGSTITKTWDEFRNVVRSSAVLQEPTDYSESLIGDALHRSNGPSHIGRRRLVNRLVRPEALATSREDLLLPALRRQLGLVYASPDADGAYRMDLVPFAHRMFLQFAASLIGLIDVDRDERLDRLEELFEGLDPGFRVKFARGNHEQILIVADEAKQIYIEEFYEPAMRLARERAAEGIGAEGGDVNLMSLMAQGGLDPRWADEDIAIKDTLLLFTATVGTSAALLVHSVDELMRWVKAHPEDAERLDDLEFLSLVVMEALRLHPGNPGAGRLVREDFVTEDGHQYHEGQWVSCLHLEANTDPTVFGDTAEEFNPYREVPTGVPRYGTSLGAGSHQCLGLRIVLGNDGHEGSHAYILRALMAAGIAQDPGHPATLDTSTDIHLYDHYPVTFSSLENIL